MPLVIGSPWVGGYFGSAEVGITVTGNLQDNPFTPVWDGVLTTETFWPAYTNPDAGDLVTFFHVPSYGRPQQTSDSKIHSIHTGNGDLCSLESSPTRGGNYSIRFTDKNSVNGTEPADCDPSGGGNCALRRSQLQMTEQFETVLPHQTERWFSLSVFMPADFSLLGGSGRMSANCVVS